MSTWKKIFVSYGIAAGNLLAYEFTMSYAVNPVQGEPASLWAISHYLSGLMFIIFFATILEDVNEKRKKVSFTFIILAFVANIFLGFMIASSAFLSLNFNIFICVQLLLVIAQITLLLKLKRKIVLRFEERRHIEELKKNIDETYWSELIFSGNLQQTRIFWASTVALTNMCLMIILVFLQSPSLLGVMLVLLIVGLNAAENILFFKPLKKAMRNCFAESIPFLVGYIIYYHYNVVEFQETRTVLFLPIIVFALGILPWLLLKRAICKKFLEESSHKKKP
jgi:hypothetical protein